MKVFIGRLSVLLCIALCTAMTWPNGKEITITARIAGCGSQLSLFEFDGITFTRVQDAKAKEDGSFEFILPKSAPLFYYVGKSPSSIKPVILGSEDKLILSGSCENIRSLQINGSSLNKKYNEVKSKINYFKSESNKLVRAYRTAGRNQEKVKELHQKMKSLDDEKMIYLDSMKQVEPYLSAVIAINTYLSYQNNKTEHKNEIEYFAKEFFGQVDFSDQTYDHLPWVYEGFKAYTETLSNVRLPFDMQRQYIEDNLAKIPEKSRAQQLALGGIIAGYRKENGENFVYFSEQFIKKFGKSQEIAAADLQKQIDKVKNFMIGGEAPDFSMATPAGEDFQLSSLRGKYVLVDFWASWCGPCRKENPNVVRLYNKYKDKGFDIIGVSLDKTKDRWLQAIERDGLTWHHVSDLRGWQNKVAKTYGVSSIPHTLLLDKDGKIVAKQLRGPSLEAKLAEIFGE